MWTGPRWCQHADGGTDNRTIAGVPARLCRTPSPARLNAMPHQLLSYWQTPAAAIFALASLLSGLILSPPSPTSPGIAALAVFGPARPASQTALPGVPEWLADGTSPPEPSTSEVQEVADFFAHVTPDDVTRLAKRFPQILGNLDGAPPKLRYTANQTGRSRFEERQILAYDNRGDGRIVEVVGDLDEAGRVAVLVPGVDTRLSNFDSGLGGVQRRAPAWQARMLLDQIRAIDRFRRVAVVAWLGYDPPEGLTGDVLREDRADTGAAALDRFIDGLVVGRPERSVVVIGHSYGSTVAGLAAARLSDQVTDLVAIGSPGMGTDGIAGLRTTARVWACAAPGDWIRRVPGVRLLGVGHGRLPSDPDFGALPLPCDDTEGHDGYFMPGTSSLRALAAVAATGTEAPADVRARLDVNTPQGSRTQTGSRSETGS
ncbi:MAG TPA: alpha/beta hydrolase, partial [Actinoplanes sp.]|nr:alpha/beta hydrolase [Actinoplanes sp.]